MIAKISRGTNMTGALAYNQLKVDKKNGEVLHTHKIIETPDRNYTVMQLYRSFEPYFIANKKTEKPVLHISLNPDPGDTVSDETFKQMAADYMKEMGYGQQPYVVFKHTDIERTHIHIVSTCVDRHGKKIPDTYEKLRSMKACRNLEQTYRLIPATEKRKKSKEPKFHPINHQKGDLKSQIAAVVRYLPGQYSFGSLGAYNALLSLFNLSAEEVTGEYLGQPKKGLVYFALNEREEKASPPFKSSLFGKQAGIESLQSHINQCKEKMKSNPARATLKDTVETLLHLTDNKADFRAQLIEHGINTVIRHNTEGRLYGITFIDHESRTVWNGSQLSNALSANAISHGWEQQEKPSKKISTDTSDPIISKPRSISKPQEPEEKVETGEPHALFDFLNQKPSSNIDGTMTILGGLLPVNQGEDPEEQLFANRMKKKRKRKKPN